MRQDELERAIIDLFDGTLSEIDQQELEDELRANPEARGYFKYHARIGAVLSMREDDGGML